MALTTELDAVNQMLALIGEAPVDALPADEVPEAVKAQALLARVSREVQTGDWDFNRENEYTFEPDESDEIDLSEVDNILKIDASNPYQQVVVRSGKLYDKTNHTFKFTSDLKCDVTWLFDFSDLPEPAKQYIAIRASRQFIKSELGSDTLSGLSAEEEQKALLTLINYDSDAGDYNIFRDDPDSAYIAFR